MELKENLYQSLKQFEKALPESVILALSCYFNAKALHAAMLPISNDIKKQLLADSGITYARRSRAIKPEQFGKPINSWEDLYLANENEAIALCDAHQSEMAKKGFPAKPGCCPVLTIQSAEIEALSALVDAMQPYTGVANSQLFNRKLRDRYRAIVLNMVVPLAKAQRVKLELPIDEV